MRRHIARVAGRIAGALRDPRWVDLVVSRSRTATSAANDGRHILIAPPGGGNIGDQAMVEAFIAGTSGPVEVIVRRAEDFVGLEEMQGVTVRPMPHLLYGYFPLNLRDAVRLRRVWRGARSLSVVGADIMDGGYDWRSAAARSHLARRAAGDGLTARVLGFSWSASADPRSEDAIKRASVAGVRLMARDTLSAERLRSAGAELVTTVADTVFTATDVAPLPRDVESLIGAGRPVAVVNASGYVARFSRQAGAYASMVESLVRSGHSVVLLPHVIRSSGDDLSACADVQQLLSAELSPHVTLVGELWRPAQVRSLVRLSSLVVTGRMHLSVLALSQGVPAAVIATQGKVDGLLGAFGLEELVVPPTEIESGALLRAGEALVTQRPDFAARVAERLPSVLTRAELNFDGLT